MSSKIAIKVQNLSKCYSIFDTPQDRLKQFIYPKLRRMNGRAPVDYCRKFWALNDVTFEVKKGETIGIVGRNGSGKSTLLQIICGTISPTSGSVKVAGRVAALLELGSSFNPEFTGRENVYLNATLLGLSKSEIDQRLQQIIAFAAIGNFLDQPVKTYSNGMLTRLAFATATNVDPDILVVDEALAVGDEAFQRKCFSRIEEMKDKGVSILFVSHSIQTIVQLCDRAILIDGGIKLLEGRPKKVVSQYERLANSNPQNFNSTLKSILATSDLNGSDRRYNPSDDPIKTGNEISNSAIVKHPPHLIDIEVADDFDSDLKSQSIVHSAEQGAKIIQMKLMSLSGHNVNLLVLGRRYVLLVDITFTHLCEKVAFGMAVKTEKGIVLAGASSINLPEVKVPVVRAGENLSVKFEFTCGFLPGTYFMGASIFGMRDGDSMLLNRWVDALVFKVKSEGALLAAGFFDLMPMLSYELSGQD